MADKDRYDHLNLSVPPDVKHWFGVACKLRREKMTAVLVEAMKGYASHVLKENHLPDPFATEPQKKPRKKTS